MTSLNQVWGQLTKFWTGLGTKQRILLVAGGVVTLGVIFGFTALIGKPEYKPLFTGMEPNETQQIASRLAAKNIPFEISTDSKTISVPADKIDQSRLEIASGGMPKTGRLGFELFDKLNWGKTEFDEKVSYQRALEGELERTIQTLKDVDSARVHLVIASDSLFLDRQTQAKASVILKLRSGSISRDMQMSIARLVAGAVDRLRPEDVTVIDAETNQPFATPQAGSLMASAEIEAAMAARLVRTLEPVVGSEHVRASVNVEYDPSTTEENQETFDPSSAVAVTMQRSEEQVGSGSMLGGVPGTASNVPGEKNTKPNGATGGQSSKSESGTYAVNKVVRRTLQPAGRIRRVSAALLVDDAIDYRQDGSEARRKRTPDELKQIEELAKAAIGLDTTRGDTLAVQSLSFDQLAASQRRAAPTRVQRVQRVLQDWSNMVRYGVLLLLFFLIYLLLLRPLKKQVTAVLKQPELPPAVTEETAEIEAAEPKLELPEEPIIELPSVPEEKQRIAHMKKRIVEKITAEPAASSRLVQAWLREDD